MRINNRFRILTVCTGNICRSPVVELLLQRGLDELHPEKFSVRSAGTHALVGQPIQPLSEEIVLRHGGVVDSFGARQLTQQMLQEADLILAMTAGHRSKVLQLEPAALKRTFTVREFGRMLEQLLKDDSTGQVTNDVAGRWRQLPAAAAAVRHKVLAKNPSDNDVLDPYRRNSSAYREMEDQLVPALSAILSVAAMHRQPGVGRRRAGLSC